jgi:hypothetical protein
MHVLGRRNFLAGLGLGAGAPLLGAMFNRMLPEAMGATSAVRPRLVLFTTGNGFLERYFTFTSRSETDFDLTPAFSALAPWKSQLVVAHKFYNPYSKASHGNQMATLTVTESPIKESQMRGPPGGISLDRKIARTAYASDPIPSTALGCVSYRKGGNADVALCMSADDVRVPFPAIGRPALAFQKFFGGSAATPAAGVPPTPGGGGGNNLERTLGGNRSFLGFIADDAKRMRARLAGTERAKLDQYLDSLQSVERSIDQRASAQVNCKSVSPPAIDAAKGALDENLDPAVLDAHIAITVAAHQCGLTHVSHLTTEGMEAPHVKYSWLGQTRNHHDDHHASNYPILEKIVQWNLGNMARTAELFSKVPEGNGTMLDNTLMMFVNCCGGVHHRGHEKHPLVFLAGKNVGMKGGRYLTYAEGSHCVSDAYVSVANLFLPTPIQTFGNPGPCKGPLPGLV